MGPRPRKTGRRRLPDYLHERRDRRTGRTYYAYRGPDGKEYGLGTDRAYAIEQAIDANLRRSRTRPDLWARIEAANTVAQWVERYRAQLEVAENTRRSAEVYLRRLEAEYGSRPIGEITTRDIVDLLGAYLEDGKRRAANACRSRLLDCFRAAEAEGWIQRGHNPVEVTRPVRVEIQRARLTLEAFRAIHEAAGTLDPWIQHSMELALVTAQRREDLAGLRFDAVADGFLHIQQKKTGNRVRIATSLRLQVVDWSLAEVIGRCRDRVLSRHLLHHTQARTHARPGDPVHKDTLSRGFARARELTDLDWGDKAPPTLHEVRSLAERLYDAEGIDTQALLGHRDPRSTALYKDRRGSEWIEVTG